MGTFEVVGNHTLDGVQPGGTVEVDDDGRARRLVRAGHIAEAEQHCPVEGCDYSGSERGLQVHSRVHDDEED